MCSFDCSQFSLETDFKSIIEFFSETFEFYFILFPLAIKRNEMKFSYDKHTSFSVPIDTELELYFSKDLLFNIQ